MTEETKTEKVVEQPKGVSLQEATEEQLKAGAFDVEQQIKGLQRQYQVIINELQSRQEKK
jgi:hypothetical protein